MSAKKLVVLTYLQYILIALGAQLLFVRQLRGVLLTFLFVRVLAYAAEPGEGLAVSAEVPTTGEEASVRGFVGRER